MPSRVDRRLRSPAMAGASANWCHSGSARGSCRGQSSRLCRGARRLWIQKHSVRIRKRRPNTPEALMTNENPERGLADTNILILRSWIRPDELPDQLAISAITLGELSAGPHEVRP